MPERLSTQLLEADRRDRRSVGRVLTAVGLLGTVFSALAVWFVSTADVGRPYFSFYALVTVGPLLLLVGLLMRRRTTKPHE